MRRILWLALAVVGIATPFGLQAGAQFPVPRSHDPAVAGRVLTGGDIGFRIEGRDPRTGNPTGRWVVRVGDEWVETGSAPVLRGAR